MKITISTLAFLLEVLRSAKLTAAQLTYSVEEEVTGDAIVGNIMKDLIAMGNHTLPSSEDGIRLAIYHGPFQSLFRIDESTGILRTVGPIDRESVCRAADQRERCSAELMVAVVQPVERFQVVSVVVSVVDVNDHAPLFDRKKLTVSVPENARPGLSAFPLPAAKDPDSAKYSVQRYALLSTSAADEATFQVRLTTGDERSLAPQLVVVGSLDRETTPFYRLVLMAYDGGTPPRSAALDVTVTVLDVNDNGPQFESSHYNASILENAETMTVIAQVRAIDRDDGVNGLIRYRLSDTTKDLYGDLFRLDNITGKVLLAKRLPPDFKSVYNVLVIGEDGGLESRSSSTRVTVTVKDVNTYAPNITFSSISKSGRLEVAENQPGGSFVGYVYAYDGDRGANGQVVCGILNPNFTLQLIYPNTYKLLTAVTFDREESPTEFATIRCSDLGTPLLTSLRQAEVFIGDVNDNAPQFERNLFEVDVVENSAVDLSVLTVSAFDPDAGPNAEIVYELDNGGATADLEDTDRSRPAKIKVDPNTGIVRIRSDLDYEEVQEITAIVYATDRGSPAFSASAKIRVNIQNANDCAPRFTRTSFSFGISENVASESEVGTVSAIDSDLSPFNDLVFRLVENQGSDDDESSPFRIDSKTGRLATTAPLDREHRAVHYLGILAIDSHDPARVSTATATVYVADRNDNPPTIDFPNDANDTVQVSTFSPVGFIVARITATDLDAGINAALLYNIGGGGSGVFEVDANNGAIYLSESLHRTERKSFRLRVTVTDQGAPRLSASAAMTVVVDDSLSFAAARSLLPPTGSEHHRGLTFHRKLMAIFGSVTAVLVLILIAAIVFVRRKRLKDPYSTVDQQRSRCHLPGSTGVIKDGLEAEENLKSGGNDLSSSSLSSSWSSSMRSKKATNSVLSPSFVSDSGDQQDRVFDVQHAIVVGIKFTRIYWC